MCLEIKRIRHLNGRAKVAKHDIPCLKVLYMCVDYKLITPYMWEPIEHNKLDHGLFADEFIHQTKFSWIKHGIYSYKHTRSIFTAPGEIIVKAYIPKGTKYWIGRGGTYVSECIKFNNLNPNK